MVSYTFDRWLDRIETTAFLDERGVKIQIIGTVLCCNAHEVPVIIRIVESGKTDLLGTAELLIRGGCSGIRQEAALVAEVMTTRLVNEFIRKHHACKENDLGSHTRP